LIETDALIIGAGPVGLYQAFQLGLLGLRCHIIDALPHVGGQCAELYPDKPIYDIPGIPVCTGLELIERLQQQILPFAPPLHLGHLVNGLAPQPNGWRVTTDRGLNIVAKVVVIAAGVGAFVPKTLKIEGADRHAGLQLHYRMEDPSRFVGQRITVLGGDELALDWAVRLTEQPVGHQPQSVDLLYRRDVLSATPELLSRFENLRHKKRITQHVGQPTRLVSVESGQMGSIDYMTPDGHLQTLAADTVLAATGLSPKLGPIANWGLVLDHKQLVVNPATCETAHVGLFAVGDVITYPGKKKLIACGFHECVMTAYAVAEIVIPGQTGPLQYTTSSALLQQRLKLGI
jgi:thioredoxin reductase (NADPH)